MKDRSISGGWHRLLRVVIDHGALGVITLVLITALACVVAGVTPPVIYALVALVGSCTALIAVTSVLLTKTDRTCGPNQSSEEPSTGPRPGADG